MARRSASRCGQFLAPAARPREQRREGEHEQARAPIAGFLRRFREEIQPIHLRDGALRRGAAANLLAWAEHLRNRATRATADDLAMLDEVEACARLAIELDPTYGALVGA